MTVTGSKTYLKRLAAAFTALALLILAMPAAGLRALAMVPPWEGSGTASDPWLISTPEDLVSMAEGIDRPAMTSLYKGNYFALTNDIDMTGVSTFPIGMETTPFMGTFYGCGNSITGLTINEPDSNFVGLFGNISGATIKDLHLSADISGNYYVGGIVGSLTDGSVIRDCEFSGTISGAFYCGGVSGGCGAYIGGDAECEIIGCSNSGKINTTKNSSGGITGCAGPEAKILYCCNHGKISGDSGNSGGIAAE